MTMGAYARLQWRTTMGYIHKPEFRIQTRVTFWSRDNIPQGDRWITLTFAHTEEDAFIKAAMEKKHRKHVRVQKLGGARYHTIF
jgi:hypothetical protein